MDERDEWQADTLSADAEADVEPGHLPERYVDRGILGRGGMGEVLLCEDHAIGREVALKVLRAGDETHGTAGRFLREAVVQARLEHPSIVPVYDVGKDARDRPYFTMKRVAGTTLSTAIEALRAGEPEAAERFTRHRLLADFVRVCQAVDYAHSRDVLHRDIKPANIMFGSFGEVYVLDWGIAKAGAEDAPARPKSDSLAGELDGGVTQGDEVLGTPCYMAPEQIHGTHLDRRADVFSLGCVLYELLALHRLHRHSDVQTVVSSTLDGVEAGEKIDRLEDAEGPELAAMCRRATALDPDRRFATAAELAEQVSRYLEGDRDTERRRELSAEAARRARELADRVAGGDDGARQDALANLGRALAYNPDNHDARETLVELLVNPPAEAPPEVEREVERSLNDANRDQARFVALAFLAVAVLIPGFALAQGVKHWPTVIVVSVSWGVAAAMLARYSRTGSLSSYVATILASAVAAAFFSRFTSPFVIVPGLVAACAALYGFHYHVRTGDLTIAALLAAIVVPVFLEQLGWISETFDIRSGNLVVEPTATHLAATPTLLALLTAVVMITATPAVIMRRMRQRVIDNERRAHLRSWQLRRLVGTPQQPK